MSRLTRLTTTRLRNRLRRPWAIKPSILRGGLEMAPALPPRRTPVETFGHPLGVAEMAPALPPRRAPLPTFGHPLGPAHRPAAASARPTPSSSDFAPDSECTSSPAPPAPRPLAP